MTGGRILRSFSQLQSLDAASTKLRKFISSLVSLIFIIPVKVEPAGGGGREGGVERSLPRLIYGSLVQGLPNAERFKEPFYLQCFFDLRS